MLDVRNLSGGYGRKDIVKHINFSVAKGEFFGIIGPNGSGKTTLLRLINGTLKQAEGSIHLAGKRLESYSPKALARLAATLPQKTDQAFSFSVKETVLFGRYPYQKGIFRQSAERDEEIARKVMEETGVIQFADHAIHELSGGEQQRVYLAQALAQEPDILLLDEPTNFLDLSYQKQLLDLIKSLSIEKGLAVVSVFHDLNIASLYCDRLLMMKNGGIEALHTTDEVIQEQKVNEVYETTVKHLFHRERSRPQIMIEPERAEKTDEAVPFAALIEARSEGLFLETERPLKVLASSQIGAGIGWKRTLISRYVSKEEQPGHLCDFLAAKGINPSSACAALTAVKPEQAVFRSLSIGAVSLFTAVMACPGEGGITVWVMVNGKLSEKALVQALVTVSEAKAAALAEEQTAGGPLPTVHHTDSVLIAADGSGAEFDGALKTEPLGSLISQSVYDCIKEAMRKGSEQ
ncbi:ATP-binding cassette domain-containing protein [Bacillus swezeyi]|uniref:ABC transporter ATP-binding protein n=1 Tax=Bacillus swezeyi TaxID=1925020 RepID=UPI002E1C5EC4|nr:ATP-binding cassette domain-containing protein [Bacillus swezeyi]MED2977181.1 ATP-binding cassette domain-containing protein [Bacillus swezeyi]